MAFFGAPNAYLGVDLGTSSSKIVELIDRKKRIELVTYAEANVKNLLVNPPDGNDDAILQTVEALKQMMDRAGTSADCAIAALPSGSVFSTVLMLPNIPESEMEQAIRFAARDVVPADIDEMVLGWGRVGSAPHMATDKSAPQQAEVDASKEEQVRAEGTTPVFVTAAPKDVVNRYIAVFDKLQISLLSLEIETFPLVRSLLTPAAPPTLIIDIGSKATTLHIIDQGIPRVSHTLDVGGYDITKSIAELLKIPQEKAEELKTQFGMRADQEESIRTQIEAVVKRQGEKAIDLIALYGQKESRNISKAIVIGGGSNLQGLTDYWSRQLGVQVAIGNPWKGLAYPDTIGGVLTEIGPRFSVAVGLALRGFAQPSS